jgi:hypothetical protein
MTRRRADMQAHAGLHGRRPGSKHLLLFACLSPFARWFRLIARDAPLSSLAPLAILQRSAHRYSKINYLRFKLRIEGQGCQPNWYGILDILRDCGAGRRQTPKPP